MIAGREVLSHVRIAKTRRRPAHPAGTGVPMYRDIDIEVEGSNEYSDILADLVGEMKKPKAENE